MLERLRDVVARFRLLFVAGAAGAAVGGAGIMALSSGGGSVDVFVGSTPTPAGVCSGPPYSSTPSVCGFPDATNTGVPSGTTLTAYSGANPITTNNATVDGKLITTNLVVNATGVTIKNSRVTSNGGYIVFCEDGATCGNGASPLTIQDSEIDCTNHDAATAGPGNGAGEANITLLRVNLHGCENGLDMNDDWLVQDSYIHDLFEDPTYGSGDGTHTDAAQFGGGHFEVSTLTPGARDINFQHNTLFGYGTRANGTSPALGTSAIITNRGPTNIDRNITINNNLMVGGVTLYCEQDGYSAVNEQITNNHFTTRYGLFNGFGGGTFPQISADCSNESVVSGNVIHESNTAISPS